MKRSRTAVYLLTTLLLCGLLAGICYVERLNKAYLDTQNRNAVQTSLSAIKSRLESNLISDLQLTKGLVAAVAMNPQLEQADFERAVRSILQGRTQLRNFGVAPDMVVRLVYPLKGNRQAIGLDYRTLPDQWQAARQARLNREIVLAGPVPLVQGGTGLIARMPAFLFDAAGNEYFWGLVSAVIDDQQLYRNSGLQDTALPIEIAIRGRDALGGQGALFFGRAEVFEQARVLADIRLPGGSWQLAAIPRGLMPGITDYSGLLRAGYCLVSLLLLLAFGAMARALEAASVAQEELSTSLTALHEREVLLRTVVDEMPDVVALKDEQGNFLLCNEALAQLYQSTPAAMVGHSDQDFGVPAELAQSMRRSVLAIMASGEPEVVLEDSQDLVTGETRHYRSIKKPFVDAAGQPQILIIAQDITDIVQARQQVEESERKLLMILENVDACIYLKDIQGRYQFANRPVRELWQVSMEAIIGSGDEKFFDAASTAQILHDDAQVLKEGKTLRTEEVGVMALTGQKGTFQSTKLPLRREDGSIYGLCGISIDISERIQIEKALRESEQRFKVAGMAACDLIYEWDVMSESQQWFGDIDSILGYPAGEVSETMDSWLALIHPDDLAVVSQIQAQYPLARSQLQCEYRIRQRSGQYRNWSVRALPVLDEQGMPCKWIGVCTDVTDRKVQQSQLEYAAFHDKLTGLPNRSQLSDCLREALAADGQQSQRLTVVYIDLDGFKEINDQYGHAVGDRFLVAISKRFRQLHEQGDTVARLGGDEFVAVLVGADNSACALPRLKQLLRLISQPVEVNGQVLQVSASLGVTFYPQAEPVDEDLLLRQADQAMYQAKLAGKNRFYLFDAEQDRSQRGQRETLARIEQALTEDEFVLHYQPKVNMRTGAVIGVEALIRWQHPEEGLLLPGKFLPLIEGQPLALVLGDWVIRTALVQMAAWQSIGLEIPVSVNIDGPQLQQAGFVQRLTQLLVQQPTVSPEQLELEVLETSALEDMAQISQVMHDCLAIGVSFALDDFGTGYSSLTYLKGLPAAVLKVDRTFVRDMLEDPDDQAILEGILGMASAFRRKVIAEGVERVEHGELLLQLGCELAQGYVIARPMPASELPDWMAHWQPPRQWQQARRVKGESEAVFS